jgi:hypothetical protein
MSISHVRDHLNCAKLAAIANNDQMLAYLIDMALLYEAQIVKDEKPIQLSKAA